MDFDFDESVLTTVLEKDEYDYERVPVASVHVTKPLSKNLSVKDLEEMFVDSLSQELIEYRKKSTFIKTRNNLYNFFKEVLNFKRNDLQFFQLYHRLVQF
jgi:hypothetical protein